MAILYLCDGKACGDECPNELCHHTSKWEHALHKDADPNEFMLMASRKGEFDLWEPVDEE